MREKRTMTLRLHFPPLPFSISSTSSSFCNSNSTRSPRLQNQSSSPQDQKPPNVYAGSPPMDLMDNIRQVSVDSRTEVSILGVLYGGICMVVKLLNCETLQSKFLV